jgi:oligopeptide transport system ATP-binding protein
VVRHISHRILVLYLGRMMELASRDELYANPRHPYTQALISAVPIPDPDREANKPRVTLTSELPSPFDLPSGCLFRTRCPKATALCAEVTPPEDRASATHSVVCHYWRDDPTA